MTNTVRNFDNPDKTRSFTKGKIEFVNLGDRSFGRATFQPGWSWANDVQPLVGGESCQVAHVDYVLGGQLHVVPDVGDEFDIFPGNLMDLPAGHNAWVVGADPFVSITLIGEGSETTYASPVK